MSSEAHPEELATPPVDTRGWHRGARSASCSASFLQRGKHFVEEHSWCHRDEAGVWGGGIATFLTLANRSAGGYCGQWQTISPRAILARVSWRLHLSPRTGICYLQSILTRPPLVWPCARDVWGNRLGEGASPPLLS